MSQLDTECLRVSNQWIPLEVTTVRQAFSDIHTGAWMFIHFVEGYPIPKSLEDWLEIEPEEGQDHVTASSLHEVRKILVPRVEIAMNYARPKPKEQRCTLQNLARRYKGRCAVSGKKLKPHEFSREHKIPRFKGGQNGWDNEVLMDRNLNSKRGHRDYAEVGMQEPKVLDGPRPLLPINTIVNKNGFPEWDLFQIPRP